MRDQTRIRSRESMRVDKRTYLKLVRALDSPCEYVRVDKRTCLKLVRALDSP